MDQSENVNSNGWITSVRMGIHMKTVKTVALILQNQFSERYVKIMLNNFMLWVYFSFKGSASEER